MGEDSQRAESGGPSRRPPSNHMWTVSAVVVEGDDLEPRHGVVAAADLGDAAEQLCEYLPEAPHDDPGDYYLVAREVPLMAREQRGSRRTWVSPLRRDDATGQATYGRWIGADEHPHFRGHGPAHPN